MESEPLTAEELDALAWIEKALVTIDGHDKGFAQLRRDALLRLIAQARREIDAAAREAELVEQGNYLRELVDAVTPEDEDELVGDGPLDGYHASDCLAAIDAWDAVVASPSAAAEGFRLAKAWADSRSALFAATEDDDAVLDLIHAEKRAFDAYRTHEEASRGK